ncbi:outer membrane protein [Pararhizobium haloflavum]|uniref:outer membrane protein n=1 Tax=Pararhizobium haloflavum TaxID=2037914 RepID=UPI000C1826FB|nr:outer membrane protein [Pararhizobium haloflavum]
MRALKLAGLATAMVLPFAASAYAADAIMEPPAPPAAPQIEPAPVQLWTGPYAGVFLGYNWGDYEAIEDDDAEDLSGGAYAGYNWQVDNFVFGVEGDVGYSGVEGGNDFVSADPGVFGSVRGRVGYTFNPFMVYATGGVAAADIEYGNELGSDSNTSVGYTVGGGVEGFVTDNITARVEYRYTDYGAEDYTLPGTGTFSSGYDEHSVRAGVGLKF